jgi:hypothetical protein
MKLHIDRKWKKDTYTIGILYIDGVRFSETLEDNDRGLRDDMNESTIKAIKVYGKTAIPTGTYNIIMSESPKFADRVWGKKYNGKVLEIQNVKGFSGVRIHPLNTAADSLGCIGVGKNTQKGMITQSTNYYYKLLDNYIIPALTRGEQVKLTIS